MDDPAAGLARRIVLSQLGASALMFALMLAAGWMYAYSALAGGLTATLANAFFAHRIFVPYRAQEPEKLVFRLYGAELGKLLLTGVMFGGVILWTHPLSMGALFGAYFLTHLVPFLNTGSGGWRYRAREKNNVR